eukprot:9244372-Alexandrium_andersonii.AAC.1
MAGALGPSPTDKPSSRERVPALKSDCGAADRPSAARPPVYGRWPRTPACDPLQPIATVSTA